MIKCSVGGNALLVACPERLRIFSGRVCRVEPELSSNGRHHARRLWGRALRSGQAEALGCYCRAMLTRRATSARATISTRLQRSQGALQQA